MTRSPDHLFRTEDLGVRYGSRPALRAVTTEIPRGEITAVIGPSGCGKSTFLACLNRLTDLVPSCHVAGRVLFEGRSVRAPGTDVLALRRRIGMLFQSPNPFPLSIRRNLDLPLREQGVRDPREREARMRRALEQAELLDEVQGRLDAPATSLSGGQQQRLCLARALTLEPEVLLMDEPCSSLDPLASEGIEQRILALRATTTIVVVTHNLAQARRLADRVLVFWMQDGCGRLIEAGPAEQVFESPRAEATAAYVQGRRG